MRTKQAKIKNAIKTQIVEEAKKKRKRRTKAEMEAARAAMARVGVVSHINTEKPKRKRRTKAEMEAARAAENKAGIKKEEKSVNKVTIFQAVETCNDNTKALLSFGDYNIKKVDTYNLALFLSKNGHEIRLGYYPNSYDGTKKILLDLGSKLLFNPKGIDKNSASALANVQTILDALHKFEVYLSNRFLVKKEEL